MLEHAGSGHSAGPLGLADIFAALYFDVLKHDPKKPEDSLDAIQERANEAAEARELANRRLEHYELGSGALQIAIVLASAAIITDVGALMWFSIALGAVGVVLMALGFFVTSATSTQTVQEHDSPAAWPAGGHGVRQSEAEFGNVTTASRA